ncbi:MAG: alanine racemase [Flavobacteriales bacterium]|nr:alanine racemase [Flavobacteriales bacterium]
MTKGYAYYRDIFRGKQFPLAYVDLDLLDANIKAIIPKAQGKKIRVATKSIRVPAIIKRILDSSAVYQGLMCYSPREAIFLSQQGFDDLLMGYPIWNRADVEPIAAELKKGKTIVLMVDRKEHIEHLNSIAKEMDVTIPVCLDLDMSSDFPGIHFGVWRSSIFGKKEAMELATTIKRATNIKLDGVMGYEAQIAGLGDNEPGKAAMNSIIRFLKGRSVKEIAKRRKDVVNGLTEMGFDLRFVNGGGTGSMDTTCSEECVTEVTVGSGFFSPTLFDNYKDFKFLPAAGYAIEIVRSPKKNLYTCLGGGFIASGEIGKLKEPKIFLPEGAKLTAQEGTGEVQTPVQYSGAEKLHFETPFFCATARRESCANISTRFILFLTEK